MILEDEGVCHVGNSKLVSGRAQQGVGELQGDHCSRRMIRMVTKTLEATGRETGIHRRDLKQRSYMISFGFKLAVITTKKLPLRKWALDR